MEEIIEQLTVATAGMAPEEIEAQLGDCPNVPPEKVSALASWLLSLNA